MSDTVQKSRDQEHAEADVEGFRKSLGPFVVAAESTRMPMIFTDAKASGNPIIFANDSFLKLTGYDREEVLAQNFHFLMADGNDPAILERAKTEFEEGSGCDSDYFYRRKDGDEFWAATFISPVRDENGEIVEHFVSFVDLTRHKREQAHCKMLIDELNHRVKNTLSTVQAIVWQALRNATNPDQIRDSIESRLFARSRSHDLLTDDKWGDVGLIEVINAALKPFRVGDERLERAVVQGENIRLPPNATLSLGIAFHELATNAAKYGAFSNDKGSIVITWKIERAPQADRLVLHWQEKDGPPVKPPVRKGFGSQVIERGLAHELQGSVTLNYLPGGLVCTIDVPVPKVVFDG